MFSTSGLYHPARRAVARVYGPLYPAPLKSVRKPPAQAAAVAPVHVSARRPAAARKPKQRRFPREAAFLAGERAGYSGVQWCRQTYQSSEDVLAWFRGWLAGQRQLMVLGELPECMDPNVWLERRRAERTAKEAS